MPPTSKPKSKHFSRKTMLIAAGVATLLVVAYIYWKKKQSPSASAAYSLSSAGCADGSTPDPNTGLCANGLPPGAPGQNLIPATGLGGASQLGDGAAPPPTPTPTPTPTPQPSGGSYKHTCVSGPGPGCGGPNKHCEYQWVDGDSSGSPSPPPNCIPAGGGAGNPPNQSSTKAPGGVAPVTATADVLSAIGTGSPATPSTPGLITPPATADSAVRML